MNCTIVIPTKNRPDLLAQCLQALDPHMVGDWRNVVVADTGTGEDGTWARVQYNCEHLYLPGATFAQACNEAVRRYPPTRVVYLLNNDCFVRTALTPSPDEIIGARLLYPDGLIQHAGIGFDQSGNPYNLWRLAPAEHPEVVKRRYLPAVTFAYASIPLKVWKELGGLDETFQNCYEDIDFCLRAREVGIPVCYDPTVMAIHLEAQTEGRNDPTNVQRSWTHFKEKWIDTGRLWYALGVWPFTRQER